MGSSGSNVVVVVPGVVVVIGIVGLVGIVGLGVGGGKVPSTENC